MTPASPKAWAADRIADACSDELGIGCLVNLGDGDRRRPHVRTRQRCQHCGNHPW